MLMASCRAALTAAFCAPVSWAAPECRWLTRTVASRPLAASSSTARPASSHTDQRGTVEPGGAVELAGSFMTYLSRGRYSSCGQCSPPVSRANQELSASTPPVAIEPPSWTTRGELPPDCGTARG